MNEGKEVEEDEEDEELIELSVLEISRTRGKFGQIGRQVGHLEDKLASACRRRSKGRGAGDGCVHWRDGCRMQA